MTFGVNQAGLSQAIVPDRLRGRVNATLRTAGGAAGTLGPLAGGLVASAIGLRQLFLVAGPCVLLGGLALLCSPVRRVRALDGVTPGGGVSARRAEGAPGRPAATDGATSVTPPR